MVTYNKHPDFKRNAISDRYNTQVYFMLLSENMNILEQNWPNDTNFSVSTWIDWSLISQPAFNFFMMSDFNHMLIDQRTTHFWPSKLNDLDQLPGKNTEAVM